MMMQIIDNRHDNEKLIDNILPGEVFVYRGKYYMKTNYGTLVVNLANGNIIDVIADFPVATIGTIVNATLTIE